MLLEWFVHLRMILGSFHMCFQHVFSGPVWGRFSSGCSLVFYNLLLFFVFTWFSILFPPPGGSWKHLLNTFLSRMETPWSLQRRTSRRIERWRRLDPLVCVWRLPWAVALTFFPTLPALFILFLFFSVGKTFWKTPYYLKLVWIACYLRCPYAPFR